MSIRIALVALALFAGATSAVSAKNRVREQVPTGYMAEVEAPSVGRSGPSCVWHNMARPSTDDAKNASRC